ncbi:zinc-binding protein [Methylophaga lonarensis MPL]|uniref:DNA gyrase inhibitor YacG n=1 Tax=Methylophaga lonarensis MPL TaxID=1286106 RepID=M7PT44_9GAMM|nr:DNA gyrase inhibitor YacG [Methylophaga lonarensis]EMR13639.1 zinc-binding protein [Methylophaga lonarensis MPL]
MVNVVQCPTCGKNVIWNDEAKWRPFCSERCKLIDLGDWAAENHRIAGEPTFEPEDEPRH